MRPVEPLEGSTQYFTDTEVRKWICLIGFYPDVASVFLPFHLMDVLLQFLSCVLQTLCTTQRTAISHELCSDYLNQAEPSNYMTFISMQSKTQPEIF